MALTFSLGFSFFLREVIHFTFKMPERYGDILIIAVAIFFYSLAFRFLNSLKFYQTNVDSFRNALDNFKNRNIIYTTLKEFKDGLAETFSKELKIKSVQLFIYNGYSEKKYPKLKPYYEKYRKAVVFKEIPFYKDKHEEPPYVKKLESFGELALPIFHPSKGVLIGILFLGKKSFDDPYLKEEIEMLEKLKSYFGLTLMSVLYSSKLREEVDEKTKKLRGSYEKLRELDKAKDSFLSIVSHEMRTPITVIRGCGEFLLSEEFGKLNKKQTTFVKRIAGRSKDALKFANDVLEISRLEANRMEFNFKSFDIKDFIKDVLSDFKIVCENKKLDLSFSIAQDVKLKLKTDYEKLKRIISNLINNAYKFTSKGDKIFVKVCKYGKNKNFLQFEIQDTGIGIPQKEQKRIFERFRQVENYLQKSHTGAGLGLSIVKKIVEKLGGKVWVESEEGVGSNFIFIIPIK